MSQLLFSYTLLLCCGICQNKLDKILFSREKAVTSAMDSTYDSATLSQLLDELSAGSYSLDINKTFQTESDSLDVIGRQNTRCPMLTGKMEFFTRQKALVHVSASIIFTEHLLKI